VVVDDESGRVLLPWILMRIPGYLLRSVAIAAAALVAACGDGAGNEPTAPRVPDELHFDAIPGGVAWITGPASRRLAAPLDAPIEYTSADPAIATVQANGMVRGVKPGNTLVRAAYGGQEVSFSITVRTVRIATIDVGWLHLCALTTDGEVLCSGYTPQSGVETMKQLYCEGREPTCYRAWVGTPGLTFVRTAERFRSLSTGWYHSCALTDDGRAFCWGSPPVTGWRSDTTVVEPREVEGGYRFSSIRTRGNTCGIALDGGSYCWGHNGWGELGIGQVLRGAFPVPSVPVPARVLSPVPLVALDPGAEKTCGLAADGAVYCAGLTVLIGNGPAGGSQLDSVPVPAASGVRFTNVADYCGIASDGALSCWYVGTAPSRLPTPERFATLDFELLAHGCALTVDGQAFCWGGNFAGELGTGTTSTEPVDVPQPVTGGLRFRTIAVGTRTTCGVATDGFAYCWGALREAATQPTQPTSATPVRIPGQR
jgi:hypothetical protein